MSENRCSSYPPADPLSLEPADIGGAAASTPSTPRRRRRPPSRRPASARRALLALWCAVFAGPCRRGHAFSGSAPSPRPSGRRASHLSAVAEPPARSASSAGSDFQRRMRGLARGGRRAAERRPANLRTAHTLEEYKAVLDEERDQVVVVRFFATWCKACKAIQPAYYRLASLHPGLVFLDVPVTNHNANLHQGLAVPSLPYGHVYHPGAGLVEELRISKRYFPHLVRRVRWYDAGACALDDAPPEAVPPEARCAQST